jgi:hypothetical protein
VLRFDLARDAAASPKGKRIRPNVFAYLNEIDTVLEQYDVLN